ncbi:MAG: S9 family peptidase, partial [bacterium]
PKPWVIDRLQIKRDYVGYLDSRRTHLYLFTLNDSSVAQLTFGDYDDSEPSWNPNGKQIAFVSNRTENSDANSNTNIWIVSLDDQDKDPVQLTSNPGPDSSPAWSTNGEWIAYVTVTEPELVWYAINQLAVVSSKGGKPSLLTHALDRNIRSPRFAPDSETVYFIVEDSGERQLVSINLADKTIGRRTAGPRSIRGFSFSESGAKAILNSESSLPAEVFLLENDKLVPLTKTNENILRNLQLAEVENIHFSSSDGTALEGFIYKPPNFSAQERYPTLLQIHGGPVAQYDFHFNFDAQLFAAHGYLVLMINPRGSSGYGQDFSLAIWQDWGNKDYTDVMAGVDYAIQRGYADPERLGVGGWSYGGILTNYIITKTDRFKGAITGASEVLYIANFGHDHYQYEWEQELGLPWENRELWERMSPFNYVQNVVTPTLIMGGEKDWNCPILNSEQLYQALKRLRRTTQLVVYPDEHHGEGETPFSNLNRASFQRDRFERYLAWYDKYLK